MKKRRSIPETTLFLKQAFTNLRMSGSLVPSSHFLAQKMTALIPNVPSGGCVVELGAGTGVFTRHILSKLPKDTTLIVVELNNALCTYLIDEINDTRLHVICGDAFSIQTILSEKKISHADAIISGLPLRNFSPTERIRFLEIIQLSLKPNGWYTQFQYAPLDYNLIKNFFLSVTLSFEPRNIPPAFVYSCTKPNIPTTD